MDVDRLSWPFSAGQWTACYANVQIMATEYPGNCAYCRLVPCPYSRQILIVSCWLYFIFFYVFIPHFRTDKWLVMNSKGKEQCNGKNMTSLYWSTSSSWIIIREIKIKASSIFTSSFMLQLTFPACCLVTTTDSWLPNYASTLWRHSQHIALFCARVMEQKHSAIEYDTTVLLVYMFWDGGKDQLRGCYKHYFHLIHNMQGKLLGSEFYV